MLALLALSRGYSEKQIVLKWIYKAAILPKKLLLANILESNIRQIDQKVKACKKYLLHVELKIFPI